jgi:hypothetical protein
MKNKPKFCPYCGGDLSRNIADILFTVDCSTASMENRLGGYFTSGYVMPKKRKSIKKRKKSPRKK